MKSNEPAKALTIGGSDSGGAAGLQADLKTWTALGIYGMSAVTAVTAQNSVEVRAIAYMSPAMLAGQIEAVLADYGAQVVKTGFIGRAQLVHAITRALAGHESLQLVVDPVLVNHRGTFMFNQEVIKAYRQHLLPAADLLTPNWREAALLSGRPSNTPLTRGALLAIAQELHALGAGHILITGDKKQDEVVDYWFDGRTLQELRSPRVKTENIHGSGDTLSAAIAAFLATRESVGAAIEQGRAFTAAALRRAVDWRLGAGHGPLSHFS